MSGQKLKPMTVDGKVILWSKFKRHYLNLATAEEAKNKKVVPLQFRNNIAYADKEMYERVKQTKSFRLGHIFRISKVPSIATPISVVRVVDSGVPVSHAEAAIKQVEELRTEGAITDEEYDSLSEAASHSVLGDLEEEERMRQAKSARVE